MRILTKNCKTNEEIYEEVPDESPPLADDLRKKIIKQQLSRHLVDLREMKANRDIFDDIDIAEKQAEIDNLKARI